MLSKKKIFSRPPVPRLPIGVKEEGLSKRLRKFDNLSITQTPENNCGIFITTNETGADIVAKEIETKPCPAESCHIGFSGWHNLDIMALRGSSRGIICDHNPENALFLQLTFDAIKESATIHAFVKNIHKITKKYNINYLPYHYKSEQEFALCLRFSENFRFEDISVGPESEINAHLEDTWGWLASEKRYQFIKQLVLKDKIVLLTEEITNTETFKKIRKLLQDNMLHIDTLYVSNIIEYMNKEDQKTCFLNTVAVLSENDTFIIDARLGFYFPHSDELTQRVITPTVMKNKGHWWFGRESVEAYLEREVPEMKKKREIGKLHFFIEKQISMPPPETGEKSSPLMIEHRTF